MKQGHISLNPQRVSAKQMAHLKPLDRDHVVFCQQAYIPLSGTLVRKLRAMSRERKAA